MKARLAGALFLLWGALPAQVPPVLTRDALVRIVLENHPLARQADLRPGSGEATVRSSRGGFDPVARVQFESKRFDEKAYFDLFDAGLKVPTWYGVEVLAGVQENSGDFLDPQATTPDEGLLKAGVRVPLGQGLFIDQRRAALRKSQAFLRSTEAEREQMLNDVLLQALHDHTDWVAAYRTLGIAREAVRLATVRAEAVRGSWRGGDRPAIDTVEALLQVQDRLLRLQQAELGLRNAALRLSNHLWDAAQRPLELQPGVLPDTTELSSPSGPGIDDPGIERAMDVHPLLLQARARLDQLEIERALRAEGLKPELGLEYQWLSSAARWNGTDVDRPLVDGHRIGVGFHMPLFLRKERGELALARLRVLDADLALARDRQRIRTRINERANDITTFTEQVRLGAEMVRNNERLLAGENQRFVAGESSLFLLNAREVPLIDARIRQVELEARLRKAHFGLDHEAGALWRAWAQ